MRDLEAFVEAVRECRRRAGRSQQQLARMIGLNPHVLSHKLHGSDGSTLSTPEVVAIVTALAGWGGIGSKAEARALLALMGVPPGVITAERWEAAPFAVLPKWDSAEAAAGSDSKRGASRVGAGSAFSPSALPVPLTALVGRGLELETVTEAVRAFRLVTLTGPGGTGKTRVAIEAARRLAGEFADGVAFADLASVEAPALVAVAVAGALGLSVVGTTSAEDQLVDALRHSRLLLVADNLEHLVEEAPLFGRLLAVAPGLHVLTTSRVALRVYGENQVRVPPLSLPREGKGACESEAVQLFVQRARAVAPHFEPKGSELEATADICRLLAGLPLAIELAAPHTRFLAPQDLLAQLRARHDLLEGGARDLPRRQQTLRATLDWSYDLLAPPDRDLFARLGVFAGRFDPDAAAAVAASTGPPNTLLRHLGVLAEQSLIEVSPASPPRFWLLQPVREYAAARLAEAGTSPDAHKRQLSHYLALATEAAFSAHRHDQQALDKLEGELANIRAALEWSSVQVGRGGVCLEQGLRLATAMVPVWCLRGNVAEGAMYMERLLAIDSERLTVPSTLRGWALVGASRLQCFRGDYPRTVTLAVEALAAFDKLDDPIGAAWAHRYIGEAALALGDVETARPHFSAQLALVEQAGDPWAEADACNMLGQLNRHLGRYEEAETFLRRALRTFQDAGYEDGAGHTLNSLGEVARDAGQGDRALARFRQALAVHRDARNKRGIAGDLEGIATALALLGHGQAPLVFCGAAAALREASGAPVPPAEGAIISRFLDGAISSLDHRQQEGALAAGRDRPLSDVIAEALGEEP